MQSMAIVAGLLFSLYGAYAAGNEELAGDSLSFQANALSLSNMFLQADWLVKAVMIGLGFASLLSWTVAIAKMMLLRRSQRELAFVADHLARAQRWDDVAALVNVPSAVVEILLMPVERELPISLPLIAASGSAGLKERVDSLLVRGSIHMTRIQGAGMGVLATVGAVGPFVGLFGTVWGIMNAFIGIADAQTSSLAVVAPGIAEALFATALGLFAAIPAVVLYNRFSRAITIYRQRVQDVCAALSRLVSRECDLYQAEHKGYAMPFRETVQ